jgi:hypothetical protein
MPLLEQYIIDQDGRKRVVFEDTESKPIDEFAEYQAGYDAAPNKLDYNMELMKKIRARYPL